MTYPWPAAGATGVGSLPFDDRDEAAKVVVGELPGFAHLPELPGRGPYASMIGRAAAMMVDLHVDLQPAGWRIVDRPGADERRARATLAADVEAFEIAAHGTNGALKVQVAGPLTLAAGMERTRGDRMLADHGARRELAESLTEGVAAHVADVARRVPGASVVLQVDEPSLPAVLAGAVPTISGYGRLRAVEETEAETYLRGIVEAVGVPVVVHCCAARPPVGVVQRAGAAAVSLDVARLDADALAELTAAVDNGLALWPGVVPTTATTHEPTVRELAERIVRLWRRLEQDPAAMTQRTILTPACGLATASVAWARRAYTLTTTAARAYADIVGAEL